jgi:hypothetical protein
MTDSIVLLQCAPSLVLAKRHRADGTWQGYDQPKTFDARTVRIGGLADLCRVLSEASHLPRICAVRGALAGGSSATGIQRISGTGRQGATIHDVPRSWLALDLDEIELPEGTDRRDLVACATAALGTLPEPFRTARCIIQATSRHGFSAAGKLRLWYWLDRPLSCADLKLWIGREWQPPIDRSLFQPGQVVYTAAPIFSTIQDPLPCRLAGLAGGDREVRAPSAGELADMVPKVPAGSGGYVALSQRRVDGLIRHLLAAKQGERNSTLLWTAARFGEAMAHGDIDQTAVHNLLIECARRLELDESEVMPTIRSGIERGKESNFLAFTFE